MAPTTSRDLSEPDPVTAGRGEVPVAIFDLDRTIIPGSSLAVLARALVDHGLLPRRMLIEVAARNLRFRRSGASDAAVVGLVTEVLALAEGLTVLDLQVVSERLRHDLVRASRPEIRRRILRHRAAGDRCVVLTASPDEVAQLVAEGLGAHVGIGTRAEVADGRFTGRLDGPVCHGTGKLESLHAAGVRPIWRASWAYSDSASDLPLLRAVDHPVAVTPDRALRRVAQAERWEIIDTPGARRHRGRPWRAERERRASGR